MSEHSLKEKEALARLEKERRKVDAQLQEIQIFQELAKGKSIASIAKKYSLGEDYIAKMSQDFEQKYLKPTPAKRPYRIVSFDGGGDRTIISMMMLKRLQKSFPFLEDVDMFAGVSAGGINASMLALAGKQNIDRAIDACINFFLDTVIIDNNFWAMVPGMLGQRPLSSNHNFIKGLIELIETITPEHEARKVRIANILDYHLGVYCFQLKSNLKLRNVGEEALFRKLYHRYRKEPGQLLKYGLINIDSLKKREEHRHEAPDESEQLQDEIDRLEASMSEASDHDEDNVERCLFEKQQELEMIHDYMKPVKMWAPRSFSNMRGRGNNRPTPGKRLLDIMLSTAAAIVMTPVFRNHVDGGIFSANPSMVALARAVEHLALKEGRKSAENEPSRFIPEIELLSIGVGQYNNYMEAKNPEMGWQQWVFDQSQPGALINMALGSTYTEPHSQAMSVLGNRYFRLDTTYDGNTYQINNRQTKLKLFKAGSDAWIGTAGEWLRERGWTG